MSSRSGFNNPPDDDRESENIRIASLLCLFMVLLLFLQVNGKWIWALYARFTGRSGRSGRRSASGRRRFYFTGEEPARLRNVGLDSAILETLPMFVYRSHNFTDGLNCAVCLCELEENEKVRLLPNCRHCFHVDCIDMWFLSHSTCPICRTSTQPEQLVLESARTEQVSVRIPGPITSGFQDNLNLEQDQTASCGEDYNLQNATNIFSWGRQKHMKTEMDEGTSGGRAVMPQIAIEIPKRPDGFSSPGEGHQPGSANGSQRSSRPPVTRLRSLTRMVSRNRERTLVFPSDRPTERHAENNES